MNLENAQCNKKVLPQNLKLKAAKEERKRTTPLDLFRMLALHSIALGVLCFCVSMGCIGIMSSVNSLGDSIYTNFILLNFGAMFAIAIGPYSCTRFDRKRTTLVALFLASSACMFNGLIPMHLVTLRVVIGIVWKNLIVIGFNSTYTEIYPTRFQSEGLSYLEMLHRLGSTLLIWIFRLLPWERFCL